MPLARMEHNVVGQSCMGWRLIWHVRTQDGLEEEAAVPLARMEYGVVGQSYVLLRRFSGAMGLGKLGTTLQFTVKEIDPASGARKKTKKQHTCNALGFVPCIPPLCAPSPTPSCVSLRAARTQQTCFYHALPHFSFQGTRHRPHQVNEGNS